jgi:PAS domain S-box-containing protein
MLNVVNKDVHGYMSVDGDKDRLEPQAIRFTGRKSLLHNHPNIFSDRLILKQTSTDLFMSDNSNPHLDWYSYILETSVEGIWIVDSDSMITVVNQKMAKMLGYEMAEMVSHPLFDFIELEDIDKVRFDSRLPPESLSDISQDANRYFRFLRHNGEALIASINVTPLFDQEGNYRGTLGRVYDITQRIKSEQQLRRSQSDLQQSEERYRLLAAYATDIISLHRATDGKVIYISTAAEGLLGYGQAELLRQSPMELIHPDDQIRAIVLAIE